MFEVESVYQQLRARLQPLVERGEWGGKIAHVYQPLDYAWKPFTLFLKKIPAGNKRVLFLGMNPGPWGMTQTGVPFGNVELVRSWLGIVADVERPLRQHPQRPITGFQTLRSEVSGERFWGLMKERFSSPEVFFEYHAVHTFCPLVFMDERGRNVTPDKLPIDVRRHLEEVCLAALDRLIEVWNPQFVAALGTYAANQASKAEGAGFRLLALPHPSPINPNSRNWAHDVRRILEHETIW